MKTAVKKQLFIAAQTNQVETLTRILSGLSKSERKEAVTCILDKTVGTTILGDAIKYGHRDACVVLLEFGADPKMVLQFPGTNWRLTAIHVVAMNGEIGLFDLFAHLLTDLPFDRNSATPLIMALHKKDIDNSVMIQLLLQRGVQVDETYERVIERDKNVPVKTREVNAFRESVVKSKFAYAEILLKNGADINKEFGPSKNTALHIVAEENLAAVRFLIKNKADINKRNNRGETPIYIAALCNQSEIIDELKLAGADINLTNNFDISPLELACLNGNTKTALRLLHHGAVLNPTLTSTKIFTPLNAALRNKNLDLAILLLRLGADVNAIPIAEEGHSPLIFAVDTNSVALVDLMIKKGVNVNGVSKNPKSGHALSHALFKADIDIEIIKLLLHAPGLNKDEIVLFKPARNGRIDIIELIIKFAMKTERLLHIQDLQKALIYAIQRNDLAIVFYLTINDNHDHVDPDLNVTPLQLATKNFCLPIMNLLLDRGYSIEAVLSDQQELVTRILDLVYPRLKTLPHTQDHVNWLEQIIRVSFFKKRLPSRVLKPYSLFQTSFSTGNVLYIYYKVLAQHHNLSLTTIDDCITLTGENVISLRDIMKSQFAKYANASGKCQFEMKDKTTLMIKPSGNANTLLLRMFLEVDFSQSLINESQLSKQRIEAKSTVEALIRVTPVLRALSSDEVEFISRNLKKLCHDIRFSSVQNKAQDDDFPETQELTAILDFSKSFVAERNQYCLVLHKSTAFFTLDDMQNLTSRLEKIAVKSQFDSQDHKLTLVFNAENTTHKSKWDSILFRWFYAQFEQSPNLQVAHVNPKINPLIERDQDDTVLENADHHMQLFQTFIEKTLPKMDCGLKMNWCREFVFGPDQKKFAKLRFIIHRHYISINTGSVSINPFELVNQIVNTVNDAAICSLIETDPQEPMLIISHEFLLHCEKNACWPSVKAKVNEWYTEQKSAAVDRSMTAASQCITTGKLLQSTTTAPKPGHPTPWLLQALVDTSKQQRENSSIDRIILRFRQISRKLSSVNESHRSYYLRAYCFYLFCLVNDLYLRQLYIKEVDNLRHALRHNAFINQYALIYQETHFLAEYSEFIIAFAQINATLEPALMQELVKTEAYLTQLAQAEPVPDPAYGLLFYTEYLYLAALIAENQITDQDIRIPAIAFTACLMFACIKEMGFVQLVDPVLLCLQDISIYVGHEYNDDLRADRNGASRLPDLCNQLVSAFKSSSDDKLGSRCLQWLSAKSTDGATTELPNTHQASIR